MKFILNEHAQFILEEKFILTETIDKSKYPNIIKFYPEAEKANNIWAALGLKNVDTFNADMLKKLNNYFGVNWITKDQCDELIKTASSNSKGMNYTGVKDLFAKFEKEHKEATKKEPANTPVIATDWADIYKQCSKASDWQKADRAFWFGGLPLATEPNPDNLPIAANAKVKQGYYKGEWGDQGDLVRSFGSHFTKLLTTYGWTAILNPFIHFLKQLFKISPITIDDAFFARLIDAFGKSYITKEDLKGEGPLGTKNLIFNPNLYTDYASMLDYLKGQHTIIKNKNKLPAGTALSAAFANIITAEGNENDLKDTKILKYFNTTHAYKLKPLTKFKEIIEVKIQPEPEDEDKKAVSKATDTKVEQIIKAITSPEMAKKFLAYLINVCRIMKPKLADSLNTKFNNKLIVNRDLVQTTFKEDTYFDKLINRTTTEYNASQLENLIAEVIKIAGI